MPNSISTENKDPEFGHIQYKLVKNGSVSKRTGRNVYSAVVIPSETYATEQLAERLAKENPLLKKSTIKALLSEMADLVGELVSEGRTVNIGGVVRFMPVIHGNFDSQNELFNPQKHRIDIKACVGNRMRKAARLSAATRVKNTHTIIRKKSPPTNRKREGQGNSEL